MCLVIAHNAHTFDYLCEARVWRIRTSLRCAYIYIYIYRHQSAYTLLVIAHSAHIPLNNWLEARVWHIHASLHTANTFIFTDQRAHTNLVMAHS